MANGHFVPECLTKPWEYDEGNDRKQQHAEPFLMSAFGEGAEVLLSKQLTQTAACDMRVHEGRRGRNASEVWVCAG